MTHGKGRELDPLDGLYPSMVDTLFALRRSSGDLLARWRGAGIAGVWRSIHSRPDFVLNLIEQGWNDLRIPGTVVPWQLFPIDSQSGHMGSWKWLSQGTRGCLARFSLGG